MTKGLIGKFIELSESDIAKVKKASGVPMGAKGALVWGIRNLIRFWVNAGQPTIEEPQPTPPTEERTQ
ncbi:MAG: hypothetical protein GY841_10245 [FCB group bacterium]|nr:hypothetical protein [FCB group bacterium]